MFLIFQHYISFYLQIFFIGRLPVFATETPYAKADWTLLSCLALLQRVDCATAIVRPHGCLTMDICHSALFFQDWKWIASTETTRTLRYGNSDSIWYSNRKNKIRKNRRGRSETVLDCSLNSLVWGCATRDQNWSSVRSRLTWEATSTMGTIVSTFIIKKS